MEASLTNRPKKNQGTGTLVLGAILLLIAAGLLVRPFIEPSAQPSAPVVDAGPAPVSDVRSGTSYTDGVIADMLARIKTNPDDHQAQASLGVAYQQKARETNDPSFYAESEKALLRALQLKADDYNALAAMGALELSRHNFPEALEWGNKARTAIPNKPYAYGVIGDAHIELGNYTEADEAFQTMVDLRPDLSSYARVSYARELRGDVDGAIEAMQKAVNSSGPAAENTAWCRVQLGNLYFNSNKIPEAERSYEHALVGYPDYIHAQAGLAQVRWAQGKTDEAIELYRQATAGVPLPQYVAALGDLYKLAGNDKAAAEQYELVQYIFSLQKQGGVDTDIEEAAFLADRDIRLEEALIMAREVAAGRKDVHTLDSLAWTLHKNGLHEEALKTQQEAMRLGTENPVFFYHMGMIQNALGNGEVARKNVEKALKINPNFSPLHAAEARLFLEK